jgi:hypothetical protein
MIVIRLIGGLGNQMFQVAAGYSLAKRLGLDLKLDIASLKKYKRHNGYQFSDIFDGEFQIASFWNVLNLLRLKHWSQRRNSVEVRPDFLFDPHSSILLEKSHNYSSDFEKVEKSCYLAGYWQSERYFLDCQEDIRKIFKFKRVTDSANLAVLENILQSNAVGIHVRRGDYISNIHANEFHGICDLEYYRLAIRIIQEKVANPKFLVFSDDMHYCRTAFKHLNGVEFVDVNAGKHSYNDMHLLSKCKHHIIANSSFSWWGAWLGQKENQVVIAPKLWFAGSKETLTDIYCKHWKLI